MLTEPIIKEKKLSIFPRQILTASSFSLFVVYLGFVTDLLIYNTLEQGECFKNSIWVTLALVNGCQLITFLVTCALGTTLMDQYHQRPGGDEETTGTGAE